MATALRHLNKEHRRSVFETRMITYIAGSKHGYVRAADALRHTFTDMALSQSTLRRMARDMVSDRRLQAWRQNGAWKSLWRIESAVSDEDSDFNRIFWRAVDKYGPVQIIDYGRISFEKEVFCDVSKHIRISKREFDICLKMLEGRAYSENGIRYIHFPPYFFCLEPIKKKFPFPIFTLDDIDLQPPEYDDPVFALPDIPPPAWVRSKFRRDSLLITRFLPSLRGIYSPDPPFDNTWVRGGLGIGARAYDMIEAYLQERNTHRTDIDLQDLAENIESLFCAHTR